MPGDEGSVDRGLPGASRPAAGSRRRRPRRRLVLLGLAFVAVVLGVWTAVTALVAADRLRTVRGDVARLTGDPGADRQALEARLETNLRTARSAADLLDQPGPRLVSLLPVIGRNVDAERSVAEASAAALEAGLRSSRATADLADGKGGIDLDHLRAAGTELAAVATTLQEPLAHLASVDVGWTLPAVQDGVREARDQLLGLDDRLRRGAAGLSGLSGVLGGDTRRTVLVGLMNNAELRGAGGLLSAYAIGSTENGNLTLRPFQDVNDVDDPPRSARRVASPADYHRAYGPYLADTTLWKNVTMSARGDHSAQVLARVAAASLGVQPDVVALCDVPAAAGIISATGPVTIEGQQVSGADLTRRLLVDAYGDGSLSEDKQKARRRALTSAATQAFARLRHDATATPALLHALLDAVAGRHLVVWSSRPDEEQHLVDAGLGGSIDAAGSDVALAVTNNLGDSPHLGNKLDYYVDRRMSVDVRLRHDEATVVQSLTLHNAAPEGLGPYVNGVAHPGEISELLSLDAAADATLTAFTRDGVPQDVSIDEADGAQRVTTVLQLSRGETTTYRLAYTLPVKDSRYRLLLVPQALARSAELHLHVSAVDATLGVVTGTDQPRDGEIDITQSWDSVHEITVPVHRLTGVRGALHAIADFWSHKVEL
jgi:hypothetical protein